MTDTERIVEYFKTHVDDVEDSPIPVYNSACIRHWIAYEDSDIIGVKMRTGISYFLIDILVFVVSIILDTKPVVILNVVYINSNKPIPLTMKYNYDIETIGKSLMSECLRVCSEYFNDPKGFVKVFNKFKQYQPDKMESVIKFIIDHNIIYNLECKAFIMNEYNKYEKKGDELML